MTVFGRHCGDCSQRQKWWGQCWCRCHGKKRHIDGHGCDDPATGASE